MLTRIYKYWLIATHTNTPTKIQRKLVTESFHIRAHEGGGAEGPGPRPYFLEKKKNIYIYIYIYIFKYKESFMEYEYSTGGSRWSIQIYHWSVSILYHKIENEVR